MKKKLFIIGTVILGFFLLLLIFSLRSAKKTVQPDKEAIAPEKLSQMQQDSQVVADVINKVHQKYPWYSKIPIETKDYRIVFDFDKNSFRIRLLGQSTETIKQAALKDLETIGVDLKKEFTYYFIEPEPGFENLLR